MRYAGGTRPFQDLVLLSVATVGVGEAHNFTTSQVDLGVIQARLDCAPASAGALESRVQANRLSGGGIEYKMMARVHSNACISSQYIVGKHSPNGSWLRAPYALCWKRVSFVLLF